MPAPLVPNDVLPTLGFVAVGFPLEVEIEVWVFDVTLRSIGVPVPEAAITVSVAVPTGKVFLFQYASQSASMLPDSHIEWLFIAPIKA
jgi:hypothetical protein